MKFVLAAALLLFFNESYACEAPQSTSVLRQLPNGHTLEWTFTRAILEPAGSPAISPRYQAYRAWIAHYTKLDARGLIENQLGFYRDVLADHAARGISNSSFDQTLRDGILDSEDILAGRLGRFREVGCIEVTAFEEFFKFSDFEKNYDEYYVQVLVKDNAVKVLGEFYAGSGGGTGASTELRARAETLLREGWIFEALLHNHPFLFMLYGDPLPTDRRLQLGGNIHPSAPDVATFIRDHPRQAWITNGTETLELQHDEYRYFRDH